MSKVAANTAALAYVENIALIRKYAKPIPHQSKLSRISRLLFSERAEQIRKRQWNRDRIGATAKEAMPIWSQEDSGDLILIATSV